MKLLGPEGDVIDAFKYINRVFDVDKTIRPVLRQSQKQIMLLDSM